MGGGGSASRPAAAAHGPTPSVQHLLNGSCSLQPLPLSAKRSLPHCLLQIRGVPALAAQRPIAARRVAAAAPLRRRSPLTAGAAAADATSYLADCPPKVGYLTKEERDELAKQFGFRWGRRAAPAAAASGACPAPVRVPTAGTPPPPRPACRAGPSARSCPTM